LRSGQSVSWSPDVHEVARTPATVSAPAKGQISVIGDLPAGATVTAKDSTGLTVILSATTSLAPGAYTVEFRASGYEPDIRTVVVRSGQSQSWTPNVRAVPLPKATQPVVRDTRADEASIATLVRDFASAFNGRDTNVVLPLLPQNSRATWRSLLPSRDVTEFSATLGPTTSARVDGDAATVRFTLVVAFISKNATPRQQRQTFNFSGSAQRTPSGWKLTALNPSGG
jgi:hypothetical protein